MTRHRGESAVFRELNADDDAEARAKGDPEQEISGRNAKRQTNGDATPDLLVRCLSIRFVLHVGFLPDYPSMTSRRDFDSDDRPSKPAGASFGMNPSGPLVETTISVPATFVPQEMRAPTHAPASSRVPRSFGLTMPRC
jgi:hypothetical protein